MCIIHTATRVANIDPQHLANGTAWNNDGHGWAIAVDGQIVTHRTMDANEAIDTWLDAVERWPNRPGMFHSRLATHGHVDVSNVHPFLVMPGAVLAHNGVFSSAHVKPIGHYSDTRTLAEVLLREHARRPGELHSRRVRKYLRRISSGSRIAILTADGRMTHVNYADGVDLGDGTWASNTGGLSAPTWARIDDDDDDDQATAAAPWSTWADECPDCRDSYAECQCWAPSSTR